MVKKLHMARLSKKRSGAGLRGFRVGSRLIWRDGQSRARLVWMAKRVTKKMKPAEDRATTSGIVGAATQDIELSAAQLEQAAQHALRSLGRIGESRVKKSGPARLSPAGKPVPKRRKRNP
ncbi:MAG TPA: hypothetical protein VMD75_04480 [Candidatus Binataceae bacterium]|nr:hypothetical protein [Candidatus Binataceae bacterium]